MVYQEVSRLPEYQSLNEVREFFNFQYTQELIMKSWGVGEDYVKWGTDSERSVAALLSW